MRKTLFAIPLILAAGLIGFSGSALAGGRTRIYVDIGDVYFEHGNPYHRGGGALLSVGYYYGAPRYYHYGYGGGYARSHSYYRGGYGHGRHHGKGHGYRSIGYRDHGYRDHGHRSHSYRGHGYSRHGRGHR